MTDSYYGRQQTPSSLPPEPPYRSEEVPAAQRAAGETQPQGVPDAPTAQTAPVAQAAPAQPTLSQGGFEPDTSGIDATVQVSLDAFGPTTVTDRTESFQSARSGDTGRMPAAQSASDVLNAHRQAAAAQAGTAADAQPYAQAAPAAGGPGAPASPVPPAAAAAGPASKQKSGAGKTFLAGFLGAALACGIAGGGYAAYSATTGGQAAGGTTQAATALLGTQDSSVIDAVGEGRSLSEAVAAKALPSVVAVYNYQKQSSSYGNAFGWGYGNRDTGKSDEPVATGMGSGVVISGDGYIITNYHVVEGADKITVKVDDVERDAEYVGGDSSSDIAVVKVEDTEGLVAADIGDSDSLVIGEWVMTVGAPLGLEQSVATGVVSATNRSTIMDNSQTTSDIFGYSYSNAQPEYTYYPNMIQTDAVINPGNSGGALVDADGKLIGINSMLSSYSGTYAGVGFAIPINYAIGLAEDIIAGNEPTHAALGVTISQVNSQIAQRYNLSTDKGAYVSGVVSGSGAAEAGLQVGDIITAVSGKEITSTTDVTLDVREHEVGDTVTVTVNRAGETMDIEVKLSSDADLVYSTDDADGQKQGDDQGKDDGQGQDGNGQMGPNGGQGLNEGPGGGRQYNEDDLRELLEFMKMMGM